MWQFTGERSPSFANQPEEGQESVWDYPRPPICVADSRDVIVQHGKGSATYWSLAVGNPRIKDVGWAVEKIRSYLSLTPPN